MIMKLNAPTNAIGSPQAADVATACCIGTLRQLRNGTVSEPPPMPVRVSYEPIAADRLADDVILLRWRAVGAHSTWLRSSVWQLVDGSWRLLFSQGTQVP